MKGKKCTKVKHTLKSVKGYLYSLESKGYKNKPWRNEVSYYLCEKCNSYHTSKVLKSHSDTIIKNQSYFDFQKENWKHWLLNKSSKKGVITN